MIYLPFLLSLYLYYQDGGVSYGSHQVQAHRSFSAEHPPSEGTVPSSHQQQQHQLHKPTRAMTVNAQMVGRHAPNESHRGRTHSAGQDFNNALKKVSKIQVVWTPGR